MSDQPAGPQGLPEAVFHQIYQEGAPWDIGAPQPEVRKLINEGLLSGRVLDLGCGTGENSLLMAASGARVVGVDPVPAAIEVAKAKKGNAKEPRFEVDNALRLCVEGPFDVVLDTGVFHVFSDAERPLYAEQVAGRLCEGGRLFLVCFNEKQPGGGPRRVTQAELHATFSEPDFEVLSIREGLYHTKSGPKLSWVLDARRR